MTDFDVQVVVNGLDVTIADPVTGVGYTLDSTTRANRQQQWRKVTVSSPFVEGEYDVQAVRGNVTEQVSVYVRGETHEDLTQKVLALTDAIESPAFTVTWRAETMTETWDCTFAEYAINAQHEFNFATMCQVVLSIPRRPRVRYAFGAANTTRSD